MPAVYHVLAGAADLPLLFRGGAGHWGFSGVARNNSRKDQFQVSTDLSDHFDGFSISSATAVPWRAAIEGVPLIELRSAEGSALAKLEGEDVECDKIVDQIKRVCLTESSSFIMPTE